LVKHSDQLKVLWKTFQNDWENCKKIWKDEVAMKFEKEFIKPWYCINELIQQLEILNEKLRKARKDFL
jgi:hypothetical protein